MPHSVSPPSSPPVEDIELPDAPEPPSSSLPAPIAANETGTSDEDTAGSGSSSEASQTQHGATENHAPKANLEAMFDDDEDDEYTTSSAAVDSSASQASPVPQISTSIDPSDPALLRAYYQRLFPHRPFYTWLNHSPIPSSPKPTTTWMNREFAFTVSGAYLRYQSFASADLFRKQLVALVPSRFEIGPVYTANPRERKSLRRAAAFKPLEKELVFDIDMTDYDEIRTCCKGAAICSRCWGFMRMAMRVLDTALREDFGYKHVLWVYSGRRGIHAWVCDKRAREMSDDKRKAIAGYLELLKGGDASKKKVNLRRPLHPHIERSLRILRDSFSTDILQAQDPFADAEGSTKLLSLLSTDPTLTKALQDKWIASPHRTSSQKWSDIDALASNSNNTSSSFDAKKLLEAKQDIVLEYTYPRLDAAVSKHLNHLLKSPFCIHPGTGRVCVPMDPAKIDEFDPEDVPTVSELLGEIDAWRGADEGRDPERKTHDCEKTRMKPYVEYFRSFVQGVALTEAGEGAAGLKRKVEDGAVAPADEMEF